jgi:hypothetical protein
VILSYGCSKYNTFVDDKVQLYIDIVSTMSDMHFWVFAVKYLSKGIEYTRLKANDRADYALKIGLYFLLALFEL